MGRHARCTAARKASGRIGRKRTQRRAGAEGGRAGHSGRDRGAHHDAIAHHLGRILGLGRLDLLLVGPQRLRAHHHRAPEGLHCRRGEAQARRKAFSSFVELSTRSADLSARGRRWRASAASCSRASQALLDALAQKPKSELRQSPPAGTVVPAMSEWSYDAAAPPPPQEHVLSAVGVLGASPPLAVSPELLAGVSAQALLDALAQKSKAELGHFSQDLGKVTEKLGKRLVPIRDEKLPQGCVRCYTIHARCDGKRPCGRCMSRNIEAQCVYPTDPDYVPQRRSRQRQKRPLEEELGDHAGEGVPPPPSSPPDGLEQATARRQKRDGKGSVRPARREGVTASGDILCPHGIEKRYCLDPGCVANGGGKAMCQHGRRRRCCKEPECKGETERKRQEVEARRCVHGRQKRLCREGDCLKEFSAASKAYREMMQQRRSEELQPAAKAPPVAKGKACEHPGFCVSSLLFVCLVRNIIPQKN